MTTNLRDQSPAIAAAIRAAFRSSEPCHCHGDGKLSEAETLAAFVRSGHVRYADVSSPKFLPISETLRRIRGQFSSYYLEQRGVHYLSQLEAWTYADLLSLNGVGAVTATAIEAEMAKYGLALKDGDPRRFQHLIEDEPEPEGRVIDGTPDEIRAACAKDLIRLGQQLTTKGGALMKFGVRTSLRERVGGALKNAAKVGIKIEREALGIAEVLHDLERRETTSRKGSTTRPDRRGVAGGRPERLSLVHEGTVIRGAFDDGRAA